MAQLINGVDPDEPKQSSNLKQNTGRYHHDVPLEHLDFKYVEKCQNVKELEKIYKVLM